MKKINEVGNIYGRLRVIAPADSIDGRASWLCQCQCGNRCIVKGKYLRNGDTQSCGCIVVDNAKQLCMQNTHRNEIEIMGDCAKIFFHNSKEYFLCDVEDLSIVQGCTWHKTNDGYARGADSEGNLRFFHSFIFPNNSTLFCDHINGDRLDNRKSNLRYATRQQNSMNRGISSNNTSGHKGVFFKDGKWRASIELDHKKIWIGSFESIEQAISARKAQEEILFGKYMRATV